MLRSVAMVETRVHVYLRADERAELERLADERGTSASYIMRLALRRLVGLPVPREFAERRAEVDAAAR